MFIYSSGYKVVGRRHRLYINTATGIFIFIGAPIEISAPVVHGRRTGRCIAPTRSLYHLHENCSRAESGRSPARSRTARHANLRRIRLDKIILLALWTAWDVAMEVVAATRECTCQSKGALWCQSVSGTKWINVRGVNVNKR